MPQGYQPGPPNAYACGRCGAPIDPSRATYDNMGNLLCPRCEANNTISLGETRAGGSIFGSAIGISVLAFVGLCFNPFAMLSVSVLIGSIGWLVTVIRAPTSIRANMQWRLPVSAVFVALSAGLHLLILGLIALGISAGALR